VASGGVTQGGNLRAVSGLWRPGLEQVRPLSQYANIQVLGHKALQTADMPPKALDRSAQPS
jgi:hypothetical protein